MYLIDDILNTRQQHFDKQDIEILSVFACICSCLFEFAFSAQPLWKECTCQVQREKRKTGKNWKNSEYVDLLVLKERGQTNSLGLGFQCLNIFRVEINL